MVVSSVQHYEEFLVPQGVCKLPLHPLISILTCLVLVFDSLEDFLIISLAAVAACHVLRHSSWPTLTCVCYYPEMDKKERDSFH